MQTRDNRNSQGIDVSRWQGDIDWIRVKNTNIKFVIIKATESTRTIDGKLTQNYSGAKSVGLPIGFYHFAHIINDPIVEADHYLNTVNGLEAELWHILDLENGSLDGYSYTKAQVSNWARKWLERVHSVTGKTPMIYTGASFARTYFEVNLAVYPLWIAHYGTEIPMSNDVWSEWTMFQYCDTGSVDGIDGNVDLNEINGNISQYIATDQKEEEQLDLTLDQWKMLGDALDGLYRKSMDGQFEIPLITSYMWAEKAYSCEMTAAELSFVCMVVSARQCGVQC